MVSCAYIIMVFVVCVCVCRLRQHGQLKASTWSLKGSRIDAWLCQIVVFCFLEQETVLTLLQWWPGVNWGSSPPSCNMNVIPGVNWGGKYPSGVEVIMKLRVLQPLSVRPTSPCLPAQDSSARVSQC